MHAMAVESKISRAGEDRRDQMGILGATPFFIVSSGRSGTAMLVKALLADKAIAIEHEYMVHYVQPLAVRRHAGLAGADEARRVLSTCHGAAVQYASTPLWGDSSNKLSWLIPDLYALFPGAKFIHLVRDGRKVASSYFHKLGSECYDDRSTAVLSTYLSAPGRMTPPPPEKKYWWPQPVTGNPWADDFSRFNRFQRIAWHWSEINRVILRDFAAVPDENRLFLRLEDLRSRPSAVAALFAFLNRPYRDEYFAAFARPHNVNRPVDTMLTAEQSAQFEPLAGAIMERLGYGDSAEYAVNY